MKEIRIATRRSPLAMKQTHMVKDLLEDNIAESKISIFEMVTTGDRQSNWSLEKKGGKGLFTKELEDALLNKTADIAIHSAKDLPTELPKGLCIAGFLPREIANDILVLRESIDQPKTIATSSPRRRSQAQKLFPEAEWTEIRGNVDTRLNKIKEGHADATFMAAAGLKRLGIDSWEGLVFKTQKIEDIVPATGQAAIAIQCRNEDKDYFQQFCDKTTIRHVEIERAILHGIGGGCHTATAVHSTADALYVFDIKCGYKKFDPSKDTPTLIQEALDFISK